MTLKITNIDIFSELSVEDLNKISGGNNNTLTLTNNKDASAVLSLGKVDNVSGGTNNQPLSDMFYLSNATSSSSSTSGY